MKKMIVALAALVLVIAVSAAAVFIIPVSPPNEKYEKIALAYLEDLYNEN